jgi:hypothetical protein
MEELLNGIFTQQSARATDLAFLTIQRSRKLTKIYLRCVGKDGLDAVNNRIAREVKKRYKLTSTGQRNTAPESLLISGYTIFESQSERAESE